MAANRSVAGIAFGLIAYGIWGFFPLYFHQLSGISPMDILSNRAVWAFVFVGILLTLRQRWGTALAIFRTPRHIVMLTLAALLLRDGLYSQPISNRLKYAVLGVLFVNVSIGGTLTPDAAPPVLMVASV